MSQDPIRAMRDRAILTKRARRDDAYTEAMVHGTAPTALSFCAALDLGMEGADALAAAHQIDQAALAFADDTPPAA